MLSKIQQAELVVLQGSCYKLARARRPRVFQRIQFCTSPNAWEECYYVLTSATLNWGPARDGPLKRRIFLPDVARLTLLHGSILERTNIARI